MKVQIKSEGERVKQFLIDEHDLTKAPISQIDICFNGEDKPKLLLEVYPEDIKIEGDFEVFKKIKELPEENKKNISFSIGDIKAEIGTEEFAKEISKHLEQILKSYR